LTNGTLVGTVRLEDDTRCLDRITRSREEVVRIATRHALSGGGVSTSSKYGASDFARTAAEAIDPFTSSR